MVVDDNHDAADSLAMLIELLGAEVRVVNDGPSALQTLEAYHPDVVLLDIGMPGMDGYEVARRIRQQPKFKSTRLIALTGWRPEDDSRNTGFDHHLVKPVDMDALEALLASSRP